MNQKLRPGAEQRQSQQHRHAAILKSHTYRIRNQRFTESRIKFLRSQRECIISNSRVTKHKLENLWSGRKQIISILQATSDSVRVLPPPLDRPALGAPLPLTTYAQGQPRLPHHLSRSHLEPAPVPHPYPFAQIPAPDPFVPKLSVHSPTGPGSRRSCQTCR